MAREKLTEEEVSFYVLSVIGFAFVVALYLYAIHHYYLLPSATITNVWVEEDTQSFLSGICYDIVLQLHGPSQDPFDYCQVAVESSISTPREARQRAAGYHVNTTVEDAFYREFRNYSHLCYTGEDVLFLHFIDWLAVALVSGMYILVAGLALYHANKRFCPSDYTRVSTIEVV
jgi:hypothetical protein